uniref:Plastocyanin-like domain-containing protein n=1 Tax=Schistosoma curassoni TaxID=6186 RepID=A0A183JYZ1_9TREM
MLCGSELVDCWVEFYKHDSDPLHFHTHHQAYLVDCVKLQDESKVNATEGKVQLREPSNFRQDRTFLVCNKHY